MNSFKWILFTCLLTGLMVTAVACQEDGAASEETITDGDVSEVEPTETPEDEPVDTAQTNIATSDSDVTTIITFAIDDWERSLYEEQIKTFEVTHPDIKVELILTDELLDDESQGIFTDDGVYLDKSLVKLARSVDVVSWNIQPDFVPDGLLLDLEPLIAVDEDFDATDFYPGTLEQYQWDGGIWGVPLNASYLLIYYDKDLFDQAGIAYPEVGWSWDDLLATARATTIRDGDEVTQWGVSFRWIGTLTLVQAKVGSIFNVDYIPPTARFIDPDVVAAYQWFADLHTEHEVAPYVSLSEEMSDIQAFLDLAQDGKVAMWSDSLESYSWYAKDRNVGVVPFPIGPDNLNSSPAYKFNEGVLAVSAGTTHPEAAWEWVTFLTQQGTNENSFFKAPDQVHLPARRSVAEANHVWEEMNEELATAVRFAIDHVSVHSYVPIGGTTGPWLYSAFPRMVDEGRDAEDVLAEIQKDFDAAIEASGDTISIPAFTVADPSGVQSVEGDVVVRFIGRQHDLSLYRKIAEEFQKLHPEIVIKIENAVAYSDASVKNLSGVADVFELWGPIQTEEDLAYILPIQPLLDADPELAEQDFFSTALDPFRVQGQVVGIPGQIRIPYLYYNKQLFDAAGVAYPQPGWTMDEFLETAVALTEDGDAEEKVYGYVPESVEVNEIMHLITAHGGTIIDDSVDPPTTRLTDPHVISAMRWYSNLTTEYAVKPTFDVDAYEERKQLIDSDRVAIWAVDLHMIVRGELFDEKGDTLETEGGGSVDRVAEDNDAIGVVSYPVGDQGMAPFDAVTGYYIAADTDVREAAWTWMKFLTTQESLANPGLPARISIAESNEFKQRVGAENASALIEMAQNSSQELMDNDPALWLSLVVSIALEDAYQRIIEDEATVEEAMQNAQNKTEIYRLCVIEQDLITSNDFAEFEACLDEAGLSLWGG